MNKQTEALKMAIKLLREFEPDWECEHGFPHDKCPNKDCGNDTKEYWKVIHAIEEALEQPAQEPVAWMHYKTFDLIYHDVWEELIEGKDEWYPLYQNKGEDMNTNKQQAVNLILTNPENGEDMFFASDITNNVDGSYSFEVANKDNSARYKHTIKTEELL